MAQSLYPLKFTPRLVEKMWGGRKLETVFHKPLPPGKPIGESWELYDFPPGVCDNSTDWVSSPIANGPLAGKTLHWAMGQFGADLLGSAKPTGEHGQFPLLIKFLDAKEDLSVQVHPDEKYARANRGAHLKTEAWYVIDNEPGARLLKGLAPGVKADALRKAISAGTVERQIRACPVKPGDCHFLPSGTVHALGGGILVAEVQTPSDTTFRVFDFNRVDPSTGKTRTLHVEQAMQCIDFDSEPPEQPRSHVAGPHTTVTRLVSCPYFTIEKVRFSEGVAEPLPYDQPVVWIVLEGRGNLKADGAAEPTPFAPGDTLLLPAAMKNPVLRTQSDCVWLEVTLPAAG